MSPETRIRRNPEVIAAEALGESVLLNPQTWTYLSFNETATWVWRLLEQPRSLEWLVCAAQDKYRAAPQEIQEDLGEFLETAAEEGFLLRERA